MIFLNYKKMNIDSQSYICEQILAWCSCLQLVQDEEVSRVIISFLEIPTDHSNPQKWFLIPSSVTHFTRKLALQPVNTTVPVLPNFLCLISSTLTILQDFCLVVQC